MKRSWGERFRPPRTTGCGGTRLPLGARAEILRKAVGLAERHLAAGTLLSGAPLGRCRSLLPMWGRVCAGLSARPYFAARREVMLQLLCLAMHCRDSWVRRLRALARMWPLLSGRFLMDYFPRPPDGGPPLLPYARRPPHLAPADQWPSCLRTAGLFPLRLAQGVERDLLVEFLYRLYGM